jgi:hypothetical protein
VFLYSEEIVFDFSKLNTGHELKVVVSYLNLFASTYAPVSIDMLRKDSYELQIIIADIYIDEIYNFLTELKGRKFEFNEVVLTENTRCCVDFYFDNEIYFYYAINYYATGIIANGQTIKNDEIFYDFLKRFLPQKEVTYINDNLKSRKR